MRIVLAASFLESQAETLKSVLGGDVSVDVADWDTDADRLARLLASADVCVSYRWTASIGTHAGRLRLLHNTGAGMDKIDVQAVPPGAYVANCFEHERAIAEYVVMACLALSRNLIQSDDRIRQSDWSTAPVYGHAFYSELGGTKIGVVGLGRIGGEVARLVQPFGMIVRAVTRSPVDPSTAEEMGLEWCGSPTRLDELLETSDFVVVAVPLTAETRGLLGRRELRLMKTSAFLVNVARAEIIDEAALYDALKEETIAGAALDPWWHYPSDGTDAAPSGHAFGSLSNVLMTPHYAGATRQTLERRMAVIAENIRRLRANEPLINVIRPPLSVAPPNGDRR